MIMALSVERPRAARIKIATIIAAFQVRVSVCLGFPNSAEEKSLGWYRSILICEPANSVTIRCFNFSLCVTLEKWSCFPVSHSKV